MFGRLLFYLFLIKFAIGNPILHSTTTENGTISGIFTTVGVTVPELPRENTTVSQNVTVKAEIYTTQKTVPTPTVPANNINDKRQTTKQIQYAREEIRDSEYETSPVQYSTYTSPHAMTAIIVFFVIFGIIMFAMLCFFFYRCMNRRG